MQCLLKFKSLTIIKTVSTFMGVMWQFSFPSFAILCTVGIDRPPLPECCYCPELHTVLSHRMHRKQGTARPPREWPPRLDR